MQNIKLSATAQHLQSNQRKLWWIMAAFGLLLLLVIYDIATGPGKFSFTTILETILAPQNATERLRVIVFDLRMPIAMMALLTGIMLAVAGTGMQTILHNPLADPFTLGVSAAAGFGAALAIVTGISVIPGFGATAITVNAFFFALLASFLLLSIVQLKGVSVDTMILTGIAMLFAFNALLALLQYNGTESQVQQIVFWTLGSLARATWWKVGVCAVITLVAVPLLLSRSNALTALQFGEERAISLGVNIKRLRVEILILTSLLAAVSVSYVGSIGFIGLVGPHLARMLIGENQRYFVPMAAICGGILLSFTSIVSKSIIPGVIYPIGIITSLIGIPFFLSMVLAQKRKN